MVRTAGAEVRRADFLRYGEVRCTVQKYAGCMSRRDERAVGREGTDGRAERAVRDKILDVRQLVAATWRIPQRCTPFGLDDRKESIYSPLPLRRNV